MSTPRTEWDLAKVPRKTRKRRRFLRGPSHQGVQWAFKDAEICSSRTSLATERALSMSTLKVAKNMRTRIRDQGQVNTSLLR